MALSLDGCAPSPKEAAAFVQSLDSIIKHLKNNDLPGILHVGEHP
jgi:hypothetical protein